MYHSPTITKLFVLCVFIASGAAFYCYVGSEHGHEIMAYKRASMLFEHGIDPYKKANLLEPLVAEVSSYTLSGLMVWNPPTLFIGFKPLLSLNTPFLAHYWALTSIIIAFGTTYLLTLLYGSINRIYTAVCCIAILWCSPALRLDLTTGQMATILSCVATMSVVLFLKEYFFISGFLLSLLIIKPHIFSLVFLTLLLISFRKRTLRFVSGLISGGLFQALLAEIRFPGIWKLWLFREEWPFQNNIGASLGSLLSNAPYRFNHYLSYLPFVIFTLFLLVKIFKNNYFHHKAIQEHIIALALILSPLASPYGFLFDQMVSLSATVLLVCWNQHKRRIIPYLFMLSMTVVYAARHYFNGNEWNQLMLIFEAEASMPALFFLIGLYCYRLQEKQLRERVQHATL